MILPKRFPTVCHLARPTPIRLVILTWLLGAVPAPAQAPALDVIYSRQPTFLIPFQTDPGDRRVHQVELFVSTDQGRSWQSYGIAVPEAGTSKGSFRFTAVRDAVYWFAVRTSDNQGHLYPATLDGLRAGLKVCVDTQKPIITLQPLAARDGMVGVSWDIRDDNLNPASLRLEYRLANSVAWQLVPLSAPGPIGQQTWSPGTNAMLEVRLRAADWAENWSEAVIPLTPGAGGGTAAVPPPAAPTTDPTVRIVNSKQISLDYDLQEVGPSGVIVELWYTTDGRNWQKYKEQRDPPKPYVFTFEVNGEGVYGFTLVVRSGVGLGGQPPRVGERPQVWVEVDLTRPEVQVLNVDVGRGTEAGNLTVTWRATDRNLTKQPITLSYTEQPGGPWTPIAANVENTGRYVWRMPSQGVPHKLWVRVEAADRAGNIGAADWGKEVIIDLKVPKVNIIGVAPAK
jgi:hypothetical protein